jgi:hypothetical protein
VLFAAVRNAKKDLKHFQRLIKLLLDCGIDIKKKNKNQQTALDVADQQK